MREWAVILLCTETYLVLVKEPWCSPLPALLTLPASLGKALPCSLLPPRNGHSTGHTGTQKVETERCLSLFTLPKTCVETQARHWCWECFPLSPTSFLLSELVSSSEEGLRFRAGISHARERINICGEAEVKQRCRNGRGNNPEFISLEAVSVRYLGRPRQCFYQ